MTTKEQIKNLTLEEKAALLQGKTVWTTYSFAHADIPEIFLSDGPHGLRKQAGAADHLGLNESVPSTCFPTAATMANSWNTALAEELGVALGREAMANDVHVVLGPGLNIKRSPLCGRNFEYFSEDPYLSGKMAAAYVRGIQRNGVAACPKHFAVNSQELRRMAMDSVLDERTLREIYLSAFECAVKEGGAKAIMSSYNMNICITVCIGDLVVINFGQPVVCSDGAGVGKDQSAHGIGDRGVFLDTPVIDVHIVIHGLLEVQDGGLGITQFGPLTAIEDVCFSHIAVPGLHQYGFHTVLNIFNLNETFLDLRLKVRRDFEGDEVDDGGIVLFLLRLKSHFDRIGDLLQIKLHIFSVALLDLIHLPLPFLS